MGILAGFNEVHRWNLLVYPEPECGKIKRRMWVEKTKSNCSSLSHALKAPGTYTRFLFNSYSEWLCKEYWPMQYTASIDQKKELVENFYFSARSDHVAVPNRTETTGRRLGAKLIKSRMKSTSSFVWYMFQCCRACPQYNRPKLL